MSKIAVIGHKTPDTDATCSPIVYAWFINKTGREAESYVTGKLNKETQFVLDHFNIKNPEVKESVSDGEQLVILDTNNPEELLTNYENAEILEIVDHHKLSGLKTESPLKITMDTVGCTATLVYRIIKNEKVEMDPDMAGLLLSAILSDTLKFTSPTTTQEDQSAADELAAIASVDVEKLANDMFAAKSDLSGMTAKDILLMDSKIFEMSGKKIRVSSLETTNPANAKNMKPDLLTAMAEIRNEEELDGVFFFIVDILKSNAEVLAWSDEEKNILEKAFGIKYEDFALLSGVVSRKKQIVPNMEKAYSA